MFARLAWPALVAWTAAALFLFAAQLSVVPRLALLLIAAAGAVLALGAAVRAVRAPVGRGVRLLACSANVSVVMLIALEGLSVRCIVDPDDRGLHVAARKCKDYHDAARLWEGTRGQPPESLAAMEAPLRAGDEPFVVVEADPWGGPYVLRRDGRALAVWSWGPDGAEGTEDDIVYPPRR